MQVSHPKLVNPQGNAARRAASALQRLLQPGPEFSLVDRLSPERAATEHYIAEQFANIYAADVKAFMPQLLTMRCQGNLSAVAGMRCAASEQLFVENYLTAPIEELAARNLRLQVNRRDVIEIGNLVATQRGASQLFFIFFAALAHDAGFKVASFAATRHVQKIVSRLGFVACELGAADPKKLGAQAASWGSYYRTSPVVLVVDVARTHRALMANPLAHAAISFFRAEVEQLAAGLR